jgi:hypothetical protein
MGIGKRKWGIEMYYLVLLTGTCNRKRRIFDSVVISTD